MATPSVRNVEHTCKLKVRGVEFEGQIENIEMSTDSKVLTSIYGETSRVSVSTRTTLTINVFHKSRVDGFLGDAVNTAIDFEVATEGQKISGLGFVENVEFDTRSMGYRLQVVSSNCTYEELETTIKNDFLSHIAQQALWAV